MQSPSNNGNTQNTNRTVFLLLFVGFIIGFSVGFATKDTIVGTVASWMVKTDQPADKKIERLPHKGSPLLQPTESEDEKSTQEEDQPQVLSEPEA